MQNEVSYLDKKLGWIMAIKEKTGFFGVFFIVESSAELVILSRCFNVFHVENR